MSTTKIPTGYTITRLVGYDGYVSYKVTAVGVRGCAVTDYRREAVEVARSHARSGHWGLVGASHPNSQGVYPTLKAWTPRG